MQRLFKKQLLVQNVQMDGSINYMVNGDINILPCPWESEKQVIVEFKFPRRYGLELTKKLYAEESDQVMSYLKTRKEDCLWNQQ